MKPISSYIPSQGSSSNAVIAGTKKSPSRSADTSTRDGLTGAAPFRREVPLANNSEFVIADGKKYFLNVPRGTYVNILV